MSENRKIEQLDAQLLNIQSLTELHCMGCVNLVNPPYHGVADLGLGQIRRFFLDQGNTSNVKKRISTALVAVVGCKGAGKSTLIQSLQQRLQLTENSNAASEEFAYSKLEIEKDFPIRLVSFGENEAHHAAYQLVFHSNCTIPIIVVNLKHFVQRSAKQNDRNAAKSLVVDWLSHFYLSVSDSTSPSDLLQPLLVITHTDLDNGKEYQGYEQRLLKACNDLKYEIYHAPFSAQSSMPTFLNNACPLFPGTDSIFTIGGKDGKSIGRLISYLSQKSQKENCCDSIPPKWYNALKWLQSNSFEDKKYLELRDLTQKFVEEGIAEHDSLKPLLRYAHKVGYILWFENVENISRFVFHKPQIIVHLLEKTFSKSFSDFKKLLEELEMKFPMAISILQKFKLVPPSSVTVSDDNFLHFFPFMAKGKINLSGETLVLCTNILLKTGNLPKYAYRQLAVEMFSFHKGPSTTICMYENGIAIQWDEMDLQFTCNTAECKLQIAVTTSAKVVNLSWKILISSILLVSTYLRDSWKLLLFVLEYLCPHCMHQNADRPGKLLNSGFLREIFQMLYSEGIKDLTYASGVIEEVKCPSTSEMIPSVLLQPCKCQWDLYEYMKLFL